MTHPDPSPSTDDREPAVPEIDIESLRGCRRPGASWSGTDRELAR